MDQNIAKIYWSKKKQREDFEVRINLQEKEWQKNSYRRHVGGKENIKEEIDFGNEIGFLTLFSDLDHFESFLQFLKRWPPVLDYI